jgi:hypothetical protein
MEPNCDCTILPLAVGFRLLARKENKRWLKSNVSTVSWTSCAVVLDNLKVDGGGARMGANIYVYCPAGQLGLCRSDLEEQLGAFFGRAAEDVGAGTGVKGFNLDYELAEGEDPEYWADRLQEFMH